MMILKIIENYINLQNLKTKSFTLQIIKYFKDLHNDNFEIFLYQFII